MRPDAAAGPWRPLLLRTWSVGVLHLGHLWSDQLGGVLLLAAVSIPILPLLHLLVVILHVFTERRRPTEGQRSSNTSDTVNESLHGVII